MIFATTFDHNGRIPSAEALEDGYESVASYFRFDFPSRCRSSRRASASNHCSPCRGTPSGGPDFRISDSELSHPLRIIAYGDMRFTDPAEVKATNPKVRRWLVDQVAAEKPDAVLLSGDVPWHGSQAGDYDEFRRETQIWRDVHLLIYPALGNHEFSGGASEQQCLENWWNAFPELRGRRWYSVQLGSSVYVLNLDSNSSLLPGSEQIGWIRAQLAGLPPTVRFVFFNLHHPPVVDVQVKPGVRMPATTAAPTSMRWRNSWPRRRRSRACVSSWPPGTSTTTSVFCRMTSFIWCRAGEAQVLVPSCAAPRIFTRTRISELQLRQVRAGWRRLPGPRWSG